MTAAGIAIDAGTTDRASAALHAAHSASATHIPNIYTGQRPVAPHPTPALPTSPTINFMWSVPSQDLYDACCSTPAGNSSARTQPTSPCSTMSLRRYNSYEPFTTHAAVSAPCALGPWQQLTGSAPSFEGQINAISNSCHVASRNRHQPPPSPDIRGRTADAAALPAEQGHTWQSGGMQRVPQSAGLQRASRPVLRWPSIEVPVVPVLCQLALQRRSSCQSPRQASLIGEAAFTRRQSLHEQHEWTWHRASEAAFHLAACRTCCLNCVHPHNRIVPCRHRRPIAGCMFCVLRR